MNKIIKLEKYAIAVIFLLCTISLSAQENKIQIEPRVGFSVGKANNPSAAFGVNLGGQLSIPVVQRFSIDPGISLILMKDNHINLNSLLIPVYASYQIPIKQVNLDLKAGPCAHFINSVDVGASAEIGVEYKKWVVAVNGYLNFINGDNPHVLSLSVGYKFSLN